MSSKAADATMISIDLFSDPICPWCYIGKRRLDGALAARPDICVEIEWHSFQLNPMMPHDGMSRSDYLSLKFGNPDNARRLYENIEGVGQQAGIAFDFERIEVTPNTVNAHRLIRLAGQYGVQNDVVERLFAAYFLDGENIGDIVTLASIGDAAGIDRETAQTFLESGEDIEAVKSDDMQARQLGIQGVPFYILDRQYAVSGAQEPEAFYPLFDLLTVERRAAASLP